MRKVLLSICLAITCYMCAQWALMGAEKEVYTGFPQYLLNLISNPPAPLSDLVDFIQREFTMNVEAVTSGGILDKLQGILMLISLPFRAIVQVFTGFINFIVELIGIANWRR